MIVSVLVSLVLAVAAMIGIAASIFQKPLCCIKHQIQPTPTPVSAGSTPRQENLEMQAPFLGNSRDSSQTAPGAAAAKFALSTALTMAPHDLPQPTAPAAAAAEQPTELPQLVYLY